jgi:hypothetical protein
MVTPINQTARAGEEKIEGSLYFYVNYLMVDVKLLLLNYLLTCQRSHVWPARAD